MKSTAIFATLVIASATTFAGCNRTPPSRETAADAAPSVAAADEGKMNAQKVRRAPARAKRATAASRTNTAAVVTPPVKVKHVLPEYPAIARDARIEGSVLLALSVDRNGKVRDAKVIRSVPLLDEAALEAVKQWEYTPMRKGGVPVSTTIPVTINFTRS